jgi:hypothetical protein
MKVLFEILVVTLLVSLGWNQSYQQQVLRVFGQQPPPKAARVAARPLPTGPLPPGPSSATPAQEHTWMWNSTILDPKKK